MNTKIMSCRDPFQIVLRKDIREIVEEFNGINGKMCGTTPLHCAAIAGWTFVIDFLVDNGADVDRERDDDNAYTPLLTALNHKQTEVAMRLLSRGAGHSKAGRDGKTPLHLAVRMGCRGIRVVKELLSKGAQIEARDGRGKTPLLAAVEERDYETCALMLLRSGADAKAADNLGRTALHSACWANQEGVVESIVRRGLSSIDVEDSNGKTPLQYAICSCNQRIADLLISSGANIHHLDHSLDSPLFDAIRWNEHVVSSRLIDMGADINIVNRHGEMAFANFRFYFSKGWRADEPIESLFNLMLISGLDVKNAFNVGDSLRFAEPWLLMLLFRSGFDYHVISTLDEWIDREDIDATSIAERALFDFSSPSCLEQLCSGHRRSNVAIAQAFFRPDGLFCARSLWNTHRSIVMSSVHLDILLSRGYPASVAPIACWIVRSRRILSFSRIIKTESISVFSSMLHYSYGASDFIVF